MPELPDIEAYLEALRPRVLGQELVLPVREKWPFRVREQVGMSLGGSGAALSPQIAG